MVHPSYCVMPLIAMLSTMNRCKKQVHDHHPHDADHGGGHVDIQHLYQHILIGEHRDADLYGALVGIAEEFAAEYVLELIVQHVSRMVKIHFLAGQMSFFALRTASTTMIVTPRAGAWIETAIRDPESENSEVAPRAGAWIETVHQA